MPASRRTERSRWLRDEALRRAAHRLQGDGAAARGRRWIADRADRQPLPRALHPPDAATGAHDRRAGRSDRPVDLELGSGRHAADRGGRAGQRHAVARDLDPLLHLGHRCGVAVAAIAGAPRGRRRRVLHAAARLDHRHGDPRLCREPGHALRRPRASVDPALRALRDRDAQEGLARVRAQVPRDRVGGLGHAAVRALVRLRRHRYYRLHGHRGRDRHKVSLTDPLLLTGIALAATGLAFKVSIAPFHTWTTDVYQGAPTPVTAFMAVATKAAGFAVFLRLFVEAFPDVQPTWSDALTALAIITILVGNVGAIPQRSLKRLLGWSGVAQAGYILTGVIVATQLGLRAMWFYLAVYLVMNMAAFAVVIARERVSPAGDDISSFEGLGRADPWLAWPLTIAMFGLAGFPLTAGFIGKFYLLQAAIDANYDWLAIFIVIGSVISLGYYLKVIAAMWLGPVEVAVRPGDGRPVRRLARVGGWSPEAEGRAQPEVLFIAVVMGALTILLGIFPSPLLNVANDVGTALQNIFG